MTGSKLGAKGGCEPIPVLKVSQSGEWKIPDGLSTMKEITQTALRTEIRATSSVL